MVPPATEAGYTTTELTVTGTTVSVPGLLTPPYVAVIVAAEDAGTFVVAIVKTV